ncbi:MAG: DinB family protein [Sedimentisphaerales bacterium]|nr:DinB family protein [Sedimentisphaerales bacterium]MBN2842105.1 DinB family protein [Sedimentisphaerales bacterium]
MTIKQQIQTWRDGGARLRQYLTGVTPAMLDIPCAPGTWSIRELVIHLADTDAIAIDRMKRIITEDNPTLLWADETAYVKKLCCEKQSLEDALLLFEVGRRQFARVLDNLPDESFNRTGIHNKAGQLKLADFIPMYIGHLDHHLEFLAGKIEILRKDA